MKILKEFRDFAVKGNVIDLAVGLIIGAAFGKIVASVVNDLIMPPIGRLMGGVNFADKFINLTPDKKLPTGAAITSLAQAREIGASVIAYGQFINIVIEFLIVAFAVFMLVKAINIARSKIEPKKEAAAPTTRECPQCLSVIPIKARRCAFCTSEVA